MRLFVALELTAAWRQALSAVQKRLRRLDRNACVRWVDPGGIHLTLRFLGEVDEDRVQPLAAALQSALAGHDAPRLAPAGLGTFPSARRPRVVWAGVTEDGARLATLQQAVEHTLRAQGWEPESRAFRPHLTLGRMRDPEGTIAVDLRRALESTSMPTWEPRPERVVALMRSHLSRQGARYEALHAWRLV